MARTKTIERSYIEELIRIKTEIDALNVRRRVLAKKLGRGTWRSWNFPGVKVLIGFSSGGWKTSWKDICEEMARYYKTSDAKMKEFKRGHQTRTYGHPTCSVSKDKANRLNPKLKAA
jgi:hypothetical protein